MTAQEETALGAGTISHDEDLRNGTFYYMCQATGYKNTGKEGIQVPYPWWYGYRANHPNQPSYIMLDIGWDSITMEAVKIDGILSKDLNGNTIVADYGTQNRVVFDTHTINWRAKGQTVI